MEQKHRLQLDLLGGFRLSHENRSINLPVSKAMLVLAFLATARNRLARRDRLASLFWQDSNSEQARASLRQALSRLRTTLGPIREAVWADNEQIGLKEDDWFIDIDELHHCNGLDAAAVKVDWASVFLAGVHRRDPSIDAWLESERQRHQQKAMEVLSTAILQCLENGVAQRAIELGMRLSTLDPFAEPVHRYLMRAHDLSGDRSAALRQYRTLVRVLDEGLGVAPDDESRQLYERIRSARMPESEGSYSAASQTPKDRSNTSKPAASLEQPSGLRLVAVLAIRTDSLLEPESVKRQADTLVRARRGEPILSHGAESLYVFGLESTQTPSADAAFQTVLQLRGPTAAGQVPAFGCTSGLVSIDSDAHPVGSVIQRAARLALFADSGEFIVDRAVRSQVSAPVQFEEITLRDQVNFRVLEVTSQPTAKHELFGRSIELAQLTQLMEATEQSGAAIAVLSGDAGMGKTHLVKSLELAVGTVGNSIITLSFSTHDARPQSLIEQLIQLAYAALTQCEANTNLDDLQRVTLDKVLDAHHDKQRPPLRDDEHQLRTELLIALIERLTTYSPVLIIAEDAHWATIADIDLLIEVMDALVEQALLLLVTERRENETFGTVLQSRIVEASVLSLTLTPLSRTDARALVQQHVPDEQAQLRILERAGGQPLFLSQLAEADLNTDVPVPVSVVALAQSELDKLPMLAREACLKVSVLGPQFLQTHLETIFPDIKKVDLLSGKLLYGKGNKIFFRHALIHEAVYALLSPEVRAGLHRQAALHFRSINRGELAHHALRCGDDEIAIDACAIAAEWLLGENRHQDAQRIVERGLQLEPIGDQRASLLFSQCHLLRDQGELDSAISACQQAYDSAEDPDLQVRLLVRSATLLKRRVQLNRAASQLSLASRIAKEQTVSNKIMAELEHEWGNHMFTLGQADMCRQHHLRAHSLAELNNDLRMQAIALGGLGDAFYADGKLRTANHYFKQCIQMAESIDMTLVATAHRPMAGYIDFLLSSKDTFIDQLYQATADARRWKSANNELLGLTLLAEALVVAMRLQEAESLLQRVDDLFMRFGGHRFAPDVCHVEITLKWASGDHHAAYQQAKEGVRLYGTDPYMGASFQATLAALCNDEEVAESAIIAGQDMLQQGSAAHNHVNFAKYGSAYFWHQGNKTRARSLVKQSQHYFRSEPLGHLDTLLTWMNQEGPVTESSTDDARELLQQHAMGFVAITHPYPPRQNSEDNSLRKVAIQS